MKKKEEEEEEDVDDGRYDGKESLYSATGQELYMRRQQYRLFLWLTFMIMTTTTTAATTTTKERTITALQQ